ncbi:NAD(P)-binding protein [Aaosphaeria arxii CBS 175.79]|uniref:NAD(P)-binding protein n=1 Tax=Aaosphaeria arxii CBS 175.79 TaxID=1450172 RepID=A0A6A5X775_9PLEO|nr:NAD(P)-binding protein [Aaosphaeria arxii CBS 175.79]KAF2008875.1 NAD(P)-binding protein [Aaosphaeria arxii CBS 175.79]
MTALIQAPRVPDRMSGVILTGHGGPEVLKYRTDLPVPELSATEVLIKVAAAGLNNTDINTRIGWYSKGIKQGTASESTAASETRTDEDASWSGKALEFPRVQGADCCGYIVAVGSSVSSSRIGQRVLVRSMLMHYTSSVAFECWTFGSECDGAFAQYTKAPSADVYAVNAPSWTDLELGSVPCAFSTAENMLHRSRVGQGETVVITGASGGVGAAAVQLCKRRGARVVAVSGKEKQGQVLELGADEVVVRGESVVGALGRMSVDVVLDVVGGPSFAELLDVLKKGGRYATAGAIAGPIVELDLRTLYLKDLSFFGCTFQDEEVFANLISYIEKGEIKPHVGQVYKLQDIGEAQEDFQLKASSGKIVLDIN